MANESIPVTLRHIARVRELLGMFAIEMICLKGNHEDIMLQACTNPSKIGWWVGNGGGATLISYGQKSGDRADASVVPQEHLRWAFGLPHFHEDSHRVYVHAGVTDSVPLADQSDETLLWQLYDDRDPGFHNGKHVVHGHHQFAHGPILKEGRTDLDVFAWFTGKLCIGVFDDDKPGGPIDVLWVEGPTAKELLKAA